MHKRIIVLIGISLLIPLQMISCGKKQVADSSNSATDYTVIEEKEIIKKDLNDVIFEDYEVNNLENKDGILIINVKSELENAENAYKVGSYLADYIRENNKETFKKNSIKNMEIIFNGEKNNWLFNETEKIKKIK